jgi:hypothetical protein
MVIYSQIVLPKFNGEKDYKMKFQDIKKSYAYGNNDRKRMIEDGVEIIKADVIKKMALLKLEYISVLGKTTDDSVLYRFLAKRKAKSIDRDIGLYKNALDQLTQLKNDILTEKYHGIVV